MVADQVDDQEIAVSEPAYAPITTLATDEPVVTVRLNDVVMRFAAGGLRPALYRGVNAMQAMLVDEHNPQATAKMKAMLFAMKQAVGVMLPFLTPVVNALHADPRVPPAVKRMVPLVPTLPRHTDRLNFLLLYLADVLHATLTENAWYIEVSHDDAVEHVGLVRVTHFDVVDPKDESLWQA